MVTTAPLVSDVTPDPLVRAAAPARTLPLGPPPAGYRPRTRSRYWRTGVFIVEEDRDGFRWIVGCDDLANLDQEPVTVSPEWAGYDEWMQGIADCIRLFGPLVTA